jgi:hypothetical protein
MAWAYGKHRDPEESGASILPISLGFPCGIAQCHEIRMAGMLAWSHAPHWRRHVMSIGSSIRPDAI